MLHAYCTENREKWNLDEFTLTRNTVPRVCALPSLIKNRVRPLRCRLRFRTRTIVALSSTRCLEFR